MGVFTFFKVYKWYQIIQNITNKANGALSINGLKRGWGMHLHKF